MKFEMDLKIVGAFVSLSLVDLSGNKILQTNWTDKRNLSDKLPEKIIFILKKEEISEYFIRTIVKAYPVYKKGFLSELQPLLTYLDSIDNLYTLGRQGLFTYNNMDQCWDMAMKTVDQIKNNKTPEDWQKTKEYFNNYKIVD